MPNNIRYKSDVSGLLKDCFKSDNIPDCLKKYMEAVYSYEYDETPDYVALKALFNKELKDCGWKDNKDGLDWLLGLGNGKKKVIINQ